MEPKYTFSATSLKLFVDCPRCAWFSFVKNIKRPNGISSKLPSAIDILLKAYHNEHRRNHTLPPELASALPAGAELFNDAQLIKDWQDWRTGLSYTSPKGVKIVTAIDDCLQIGNALAPYDFKTMKDGSRTIEKSTEYSGLQLSTYSFAFKANGYKITGNGYLANYFPVKFKDGVVIQFGLKIMEIPADPKLCIETTAAAVKCFDNPVPPPPGEKCEYCSYREGM